jgi:hypothetical protein
LPVEPAVAKVGETVIVPAPLPSVNVICATNPEVKPVAVNCSVAPASSRVTYQVVVKFPLAPFVTSHGTCSGPEFSGRSVRSTCNSTVSPGWKPEPLMVAVEPGG